MTTAHRPTWKPALGMSDSANKGFIPTRSYSSRDLPGYLYLKERSWGQGSIQQLKEKDFKAELLQRELQAKNKGLLIKEETKMIEKNIKEDQPDFAGFETSIKKKIKKPGQQNDDDEVVVGQRNPNQINPFPEDQDDEEFIKEQPEEQQQSDSDEDNQILLRQFEKVRQQRERQQKRKMEQKAQYSQANKQTQLLKGNPLLSGTYSLSKRWYQDTVFKNQAKRTEQKKIYINDSVRSQFHRKFMNKYVMR